MEYHDILLIVIELCLCVFLFWFASFCERVRNSKFKLAWLAPFVAAFIFITLKSSDICLIPVYAGALLITAGFFIEKENVRRKASVISGICIAVSLPLCMTSNIYRRENYAKEFKEAFTEAKKRYVLTKHKNIDWDALYLKYLPEFEKATDDRDACENYIAWSRFCAEFHDGHVNYATDEKTYEEAEKRAMGNDYGLVIMTLADGKAVALGCDETIGKYGIHQLTEIVKWDGMTIDEADDKSLYKSMKGFADIDNEKFYRGVFAGGVGGESVNVTFIDDNGSEKNAILPRLSDNYKERFEMVMKNVNQNTPIANMKYKQLDNTTGCLKMCGMLYDSESSANENYSMMKKDLKKGILELREKGVKNLVIDIRGNSGGEGGVVQTIAEIFAPEGNHFYANNPKWDKLHCCYIKDENDDYIISDAVEFEGMDILSGGKIVILVNSASASAADHLTKVMSRFDNVTVMGFTETNGSAQGVSGIRTQNGMLTVSSSALLDENGDIFIDSGADRQSGNDLDIKVPFDEEAVHQLFDEENDYLLSKALEFINHN